MKAYLAGGWFTPEQKNIMSDIEQTCIVTGMDYFSPRANGIWKPGDDPNILVGDNLDNIHDCDFVLASTEGKDMGTLWECGYAFAIDKPTVYYYIGPGKFNIMLAATATAVLSNIVELHDYLSAVNKDNELIHADYKGPME